MGTALNTLTGELLNQWPAGFDLTDDSESIEPVPWVRWRRLPRVGRAVMCAHCRSGSYGTK